MALNLSREDLGYCRNRITEFISSYLAESRLKGALVALSGGVDSSLVAKLAHEAIGDKLYALILPEEGLSNPQDTEDAQGLAEGLGIGYEIISITPALEGLKRCYPRIAHGKNKDKIAWANVKPRVRMILNYLAANLSGRLVLGTGNKTEVLLGYYCYDSQTRVMTPEGPKYYWELQPGSMVFSMNLGSRKVIEVPVRSVHVFDYQGELIEIRSRRLDLLVTPNHRLLVLRNHGKGPIVFNTAESRLKGGATAMPIPEPWEGSMSSPETLDTGSFLGSDKLAWNANQPVKMAMADFLYLMGLFIGDGHGSFGHVTAQVKSDLTHEELVAFRGEDGRFAQLAEVSTRTKSYCAPRIYIGTVPGKRSRHPLEKILNRYQIHATQRPNFIAFTNRALSMAFAECGQGARSKRIPPWALKLPARELRYLFQGLMDSDGNADGSAYTTASEKLAYQMVELCAKLGFHARVKRRPPRTSYYKGKKIQSGAIFDVRIGQRAHSLTFRPENTRRVYYRGKVWCPSVPPYENVLVERNGKTVFCGNTKYGDGGVDILPIGDLYKTQVRQLARHVGINRAILEKTPSAGLWEGQTDEGELGASYEVLDNVLYSLVSEKRSAEETAKTLNVSREVVKKIQRRVKENEHKGRAPPILKLFS